MAAKKARELKKSLISQVMTEMGRRGGLAKVKKGPATLSEERRKEIAKNAAAARWGKKAEKAGAK